MGEVYRATDTRLGRTVALKVLAAGVTRDPASRDRFEREARLIAQLQHPHICVLHDVGHEGETPYLVMELLAGETLDARLARGRLPLDDALAVGTQIAQYVRASSTAAREQVSRIGGREPIWHPSGSELVFRLGQTFVAVASPATPGARWGDERTLFELNTRTGVRDPAYAIFPDGRFFVMLADETTGATAATVMINRLSHRDKESSGSRPR